MIRLKDGWQIDTDGKCYILQQEVISKDGKTYLTNQTYPSTLARAIECVMNREQMDIISKNDLTLKEALIEFKKLHDKFATLLEEVRREEKL